MNYRVEDALSKAHIKDLMPISARLDGNGYYHLRAANGETKTVASGSAQTAWANAGWPEKGKWAVAWMNCTDQRRP